MIVDLRTAHGTDVVDAVIESGAWDVAELRSQFENYRDQERRRADEALRQAPHVRVDDHPLRLTKLCRHDVCRLANV